MSSLPTATSAPQPPQPPQVDDVARTGDASEKKGVPEGLWIKCPGCAETVFKKSVEANLMVCPKCEFHFKLDVEQRINLLADRHSFDEFDKTMRTNDPLSFKDSIRYRDKLKASEKKTGEPDAVRTGRARINGQKVMIGVFNFAFQGGSMGLVVGEKLTRMIEAACE